MSEQHHTYAVNLHVETDPASGARVAVATQADDTIHISPELWEHVSSPHTGEWRLDDGVLEVGTAGFGLGVVRYRDTETTNERGYRVLTRIDAAS